ncbi:hypothetical protein C8F01DRAFT_509070 [Mycena amicta]|nr:hypothetical protein C8F01DRAFT_509070 [Mycena amicta]
MSSRTAGLSHRSTPRPSPYAFSLSLGRLLKKKNAWTDEYRRWRVWIGRRWLWLWLCEWEWEWERFREFSQQRLVCIVLIHRSRRRGLWRRQRQPQTTKTGTGGVFAVGTDPTTANAKPTGPTSFLVVGSKTVAVIGSITYSDGIPTSTAGGPANVTGDGDGETSGSQKKHGVPTVALVAVGVIVALILLGLLLSNLAWSPALWAPQTCEEQTR